MSERPLENALREYSGRSPARFHMPGHKGTLDPFDVTEVTGTDNLCSPHGAIAALEAECAGFWGARDSLISVNGSTCCNIAMLLALGMGKRVLLGRNCHKSVISGIALAGHDTVPLFPDENGMVTSDGVALALDREACDAVFITSPTYRGFVCDIDGIARAVHEHGALLLLDCAHGAHLGLSPLLPPVPKAADMWCVSCHKTLNALNQAAVLNLGEGCPFDKDAVRACVNLVQTSSPSYPIMLSIENAVHSASGWHEHAQRMLDYIMEIERINGVHALPCGMALSSDPTRLNIRVDGMTGYELGNSLEAHGVFPEMSDMECVTLITTPSDNDEWYSRLQAALCVIATDAATCGSGSGAEPDIKDYASCAGERVLSVRDAVLGAKEMCRLENSAGRIAAGAAGVYPPGTALLFPGERITKAAVERLISEQEAGAELFGITGGMVPTVVIKEESNG